MFSLNETIKLSKVIVHKGRYACLKGKEKEIKNHFMLTKDQDETTIITEEKNIDKFEKAEKWFKLIEIKLSNPFKATGFLATVTKAIADKDLNVLVVSTFSKDYLLVKEESFKIAVDALKDLGFTIEV